ncbi:MAG: gamma carbonic anhydrase family protein [Planctomycetes bacterium]|nr:gamma carbonic anhydrase family protein [Planctomycetota bacterium]
MTLRGGAFVANNAIVTGAVELSEETSIWFGCVLRGDDAPIRIGARTNIQDLTMVHADPGIPNEIGDDCVVGHRCILHGTKVEDQCLIGMGSILLGGSVIGRGSIIGAGALVKEGMIVPPRSLVVGVPGRIVKQVPDEAIEELLTNVKGYIAKARLYL